MKKTQKFVGLILGLSLIFTFMIAPTVTHAASKNDMLAWNAPNANMIYLKKIFKINSQLQNDMDQMSNLMDTYDGSDDWYENVDSVASDLDDLVTLSRTLKAPAKFAEFHGLFMKAMNETQLMSNSVHNALSNDQPDYLDEAAQHFQQGQVYFDAATEKLKLML